MKNLIFILSFISLFTLTIYSQENEVKVHGITYVVDIIKGNARVGRNYRNRNNSSMKGNIIIESNITYKKINYPVTSIEDYAFMGCDRLNTITFPSSINKLEDKSLYDINNLKQFSVASDNLYFQSKDGILFSKDMAEIVRFPSGCLDTSYVIPSTVVKIGYMAFSYCMNLKNIEIPSSVIEIGAEAFLLCYNLNSIELPQSITKVGENAFGYCHNLASVTYQNLDLVFPSNSFKECPNLSTSKIICKVPKSSFLKLANQGIPEYQYKLAMCYMSGKGFLKDFKAAKEWLMKASEKEHTPSQKVLGDIYLNGIGVEKNFEEAIKWYSLAAKGGNASAQCVLGDCYFRGAGVKKDFPTAINYYKSAANQGDRNAEEVLGYCYYYGDGGINKDYKEAVKWYSLSANNGNGEAAYYLAICYNEGQGIDKNNSEALKWVEKAINGGIEKGQGLYCILAYDDAVNSMNSKDYSSAISRFTSLLKYDKENTNAYINRGYCYLNQQAKDYTIAESDFKKALVLDSNNETAKNNLQVVTEYYQRIKDAKDFCDTGDQYYNQRDYTNAVANYSKSISLDNTKQYTYYILGCCFYNCELYTDAINNYNQALTIDPNYTDARKYLKSAKTMRILNAISQAANILSNSLNNAYSASINYGSSSSYKSSSNSSSLVKSSGGIQREVCPYCKGTKVCPDPTYAETFGLDRVIKDTPCPICGRYESHYHKSCIPCQGKGYIEKYVP